MLHRSKKFTGKRFQRVYVCSFICIFGIMVIDTATTLAVTGGGERVNFGCSSDPRQNRVVICLSRACRRSGRVPPTRPCIKPYIVGFDTVKNSVFW